MFKFKTLSNNIYVKPSVGYWYRDSDTGKEFKSSMYKTFEELETHVQKYREQNGYEPIENFRECWEHFICSNSRLDFKNCCMREEKVSRSFKEYISGGLVYIKSIFKKEKEKFVDKEEAQRRANICLRCQYNVKNYGHSFAQYYTDKMMARSVGDRRVDNWNKLYTCKGCTCILNSKVWYSEEIVGTSLLREDIAKMRSVMSLKGLPLKCWQIECKEVMDKKLGVKK